jgi:hypothetical protein
MNKIIALTIIAVLNCMVTGSELIWIGVYSEEIGDKGKYASQYICGQANGDSIAKLEKNTDRQIFIRIENALYVDGDKGSYRMNDADDDSKEESNIMYIRIGNIERIVILKDDPRKIYKNEKQEKISP